MECKFSADGALLFYMCKGKCGGSATEPCPFCSDCKQQKKEGRKGKCSIGHAFELVKITDTNLKYQDLCEVYGCNHEQLVEYNGAEGHAHFSKITVNENGDTSHTGDLPYH